MISTSSMLTVNLFFNSLIKLLTKISGAEAPEEIPIVFESLIKSNGKSINQKITIIGKINNTFKKNSIILDNKPQNLSKFNGYSHKFW